MLWMKVGVGQHDALGDARRPRRVDDGGEVAGLDRQGQGLEFVAPARGVRPPPVHELGQRHGPVDALGVEDDVMGDLGQLAADGRDPRPQLAVRSEEDLGVGIVDDVPDLVRHQGRVDGDDDGPEALGGEIRHRPFGPVLGEDDDLVPGPDAQGPQPEGDVLHAVQDLPGGQVGVRPRLLEHHQVVLGIGRDGIEEQLADGFDGHGLLLHLLFVGEEPFLAPEPAAVAGQAPVRARRRGGRGRRWRRDSGGWPRRRPGSPGGSPGPRRCPGRWRSGRTGP